MTEHTMHAALHVFVRKWKALLEAMTDHDQTITLKEVRIMQQDLESVIQEYNNGQAR